MNSDPKIVRVRCVNFRATQERYFLAVRKGESFAKQRKKLIRTSVYVIAQENAVVVTGWRHIELPNEPS